MYEGPRGGTAQQHEMQRSERGVWSFQASLVLGLPLRLTTMQRAMSQDPTLSVGTAVCGLNGYPHHDAHS